MTPVYQGPDGWYHVVEGGELDDVGPYETEAAAWDGYNYRLAESS